MTPEQQEALTDEATWLLGNTGTLEDKILLATRISKLLVNERNVNNLLITECREIEQNLKDMLDSFAGYSLI